VLRFHRRSLSLRADGHDVLAVSEFQHRSVDKELMELALTENRILLTEDKDFGWLVFAGRVDSPGVILIRFPASARGLLSAAVANLVREHASRLVGAFVVLQPGRPVSVSDLKIRDEMIGRRTRWRV
jgi:predicted nuclease of predicted toxin-antitoxin system